MASGAVLGAFAERRTAVDGTINGVLLGHKTMIEDSLLEAADWEMRNG